MSKLCTKCGQVLEDNVLVCPYCGKEVENEIKEETNINDIIEIPIVNQTDNSTVDGTVPLVMAAPTLDDITPAAVQPQEEPIIAITEIPPVVEEKVEEQPQIEVTVPEVNPVQEVPTEVVETPVVEKKVEEQPQVEVTVPEVTPVQEVPTEVVETPVVEEKVEEQPQVEVTVPEVNPVQEVPTEVIETPVVESNIEETNEAAPEVTITTAPVIVETAPDLGDANTVLTTVETVVENNSLETISIDASENQLVEEEEVFEIPVMPEPSIGEINPELLGNKYDAEEEINKEKLEAKKKLEEEERERRQQEELAKQQVPMERPDLLAGFGQPDPNEVEIEEPKKKKSGGGKVALTIILIIALIALVGGGAWFVLSGGLEKIFKKTPDASYIDPVKTYYEGFNEGNSEKMISAFVPCLAQSDPVINTVTNSQNIKNQNANLKITFIETSVEVVNADDKKYLSKHLLEHCSTNVPTITDYKHVFIEQKTKLNTDSKEETSNPEFWTAQIEEKWYIIFIQ